MIFASYKPPVIECFPQNIRELIMICPYFPSFHDIFFPCLFMICPSFPSFHAIFPCLLMIYPYFSNYFPWYSPMFIHDLRTFFPIFSLESSMNFHGHLLATFGRGGGGRSGCLGKRWQFANMENYHVSFMVIYSGYTIIMGIEWYYYSGL